MQIKNCQIKNTYYEQLYRLAFGEIQADVMQKLRDAHMFAKVGNREKSQALYNKVNDWYYLIYYSTLLLMEYSDAIRLKKPEITMVSLIEKYKISCVRDQFACKGMDADIIFNIFGISLSQEEGISFMSIDNPIISFQIHPTDEQPPIV